MNVDEKEDEIHWMYSIDMVPLGKVSFKLLTFSFDALSVFFFFFFFAYYSVFVFSLSLPPALVSSILFILFFVSLNLRRMKLSKTKREKKMK